MLNYAGLNVYRHTKDPSDKKRRTLLLVTVSVLLVMAVAYIAGAAYALELYGIGRAIPMVYPATAVMLTFFVEMFKVRGNLYRAKDRELLAALPVRSFPVAAARICKMYLEGVIVTAVVILPSFLIYGMWEKPGAALWATLPLVLLVLPILPVALAAWFGIAFAALIARVRHKVLVEVLIAVIVVVGTLAVPMLISGGKSFSVDLSDFSQSADGCKLSQDEMNAKIGEQAREMLDRVEADMPILKTWGSCFNGTKPAGLGILAVAALLVLTFTMTVIGRNLFTISGKLAPVAVHHDYRLTSLRSRSVTEALVRKESSRYFSSGIYVSNTIIGPILAVVLAIALAFVSPETIFRDIKGLPFTLHATAALPFIFGMIFCMMSISASSVSMEGKNWWIARSLPIASADILNAKLLFNLIMLAPFYCVTEVILLFTVRCGILQRLWFLAVPLVYGAFAVVFGLFINLKFPKFRWETETEVVKQSAAVGLSMLGIFVAVLPGFAVLILPGVYANFVTAAVTVLLVLTGLWLYSKILHTDLQRLGE